MSFKEEFFAELAEFFTAHQRGDQPDMAAGGLTINVNLHGPTTINVNPALTQGAPGLGMFDVILSGALQHSPPNKGEENWADAEKAAADKQGQLDDADKRPELDQPEIDKQQPAEASATPPENSGAKLAQVLDETNFKGTVDQQTLVDKALSLGFKEEAGIRLWELLDASPELRALCADHQRTFPPLGRRNHAFRRNDLRALAKLEGITRVPGFGTRSQAYRVLREL